MPTLTIKTLIDQTVNYLLPHRCRLCLRCYPSALCSGCCEDLPWLAHHCRQCALPLAGSGEPGSASLCGECLGQPPAFERCIAAFTYSPPIDRLVHRFKHHASLADGKLLSQQLGYQLKVAYSQESTPDVITAVPLHWRRQLGRGFNQAAYIALQLSKQLQIPIATGLKRHLATDKQQHLPRRQRLQNLRRSFSCNDNFKGQHVALVDDVMTTGTTARELSSILIAAGASRVDIWILARTPAPQH